MSRWSGLAPAVDAHLARWSAIQGEWERRNDAARKLGIRERDPRTGELGMRVTLRADRYPNTYAWAAFARSWGIPDGDGVIQTPVVVDGATINGREQFEPGEFEREVGSQLMERERRMLMDAETVYVSKHVIHRVTEAAWEMEPEPLFETDMICPAGFAVLEEPILIPDHHPLTGEVMDWLRIGVRAIGWAPEMVGTVAGADPRPGVMLYMYTTRDDWNDSYRTDIVRQVRRGRVSVEELGYPGATAEEIDAHMQMPRSCEGLARDALWVMDVSPWRFETPWRQGNVNALSPGVIDSVVGLHRRWFLTLMRFCWQRIVVADRERLSPKASRRIELARKRPPSDYSVLRIRRTEGRRPHETGTGQPLGYRVPTRAHWRRVYVPSLGPARLPDGTWNPASHRLKRIEQYWRGPEGAPIGPLHKATVVVR